MNIRTRGTIWTVASSTLVVANSIAGVLLLRELRLTDRLTQQDYLVTHEVNRISAPLHDYQAHVILSRPEISAAESREIAEAKKKLRKNLEAPVRAGLSPEVRILIADAQTEVKRLLELDIEDVRGDLIHSRVYGQFVRRFRDSIDALAAISEVSVDILAEDRARNETLFSHYLLVLTCLALVTLSVLIARNRFLSHVILRPLVGLIEVMDKVRQGDLSVRWPERRSDEIGRMGETINHTVEELEARRNERMRFIGAVVHDLRNPLAALGMNCDLVLNRDPEHRPEAAIAALKRVKTQLERFARIIDDLRIGPAEDRPRWSLQFAPLRLDTLVEETVDLFRSSYPEWPIRLEAEEGPCEIRGDGARIVQVLTNLLSNATKYSRSGSEIVVAVGCKDRVAFLEVRDRGIGISKEHRKNIFEPFYRLESAKKLSKGTGLGLSIVKEIIEAHGGSVSVHDRTGGGSVFRIELPRPSERGDLEKAG